MEKKQYHATICFKEKPPYEFLRSEIGKKLDATSENQRHVDPHVDPDPHVDSRSKPERKATFGPEPGQVSLSLINSQDNDKELEAFIYKYFVKSICDYDGAIIDDIDTMVLLISEHKHRMHEYIKDVLLVPPLESPELEEVRPSKRHAVYIETKGQLSELESIFRQIDMLPCSRLDPTLFQEDDNKYKNILVKHSQAWESLSRNREDDKAQKNLSKYLVPTWSYESNDVLSIGWLELFLLAENNLKVKACRKCSRYFIPWPPNALHCSGCTKEYTSQTLYREKSKDEMTEKDKQLNRIKKREYMRAYRKKKRAIRKDLENQGEKKKEF